MLERPLCRSFLKDRLWPEALIGIFGPNGQNSVYTGPTDKIRRLLGPMTFSVQRTKPMTLLEQKSQ